MPSIRGFVVAMAALLCLEPSWAHLQVGHSISVRARMVVFDPSGNKHLLRSTIGQHLFSVSGLVACFPEFTFLDARVVQVEGMVHLDLQHGFALGLPIAKRSMYYECVEMCAGIGILGEGIASCGVTIKATNDLKEPMCQFQLRQGQCNVIQGDIGDASTLAGLHAAHPHPSMIAAGFSCQPWSQLGDHRKFEDLRASSLPKVLQGAYWLGCHSVLLECVDEASTDAEVRKLLHKFCKETQFHASQVHLKLDTLMPTRRNRWWCLLINPTIPPLSLRPLPAMPVPPVLEDLLPCFPEWDADTLAQLELDLYELNKFAEFNSLFNNLVNMKGQVRTALHGWANQLNGCPCGCRRFAFSEQRLREKGLFGALIPMGTEIKTYLGVLPKVRHMHPFEMALVHGAKPNRAWFPNLRFSICGLGQMASPIQSCWVVGQFLFHVFEGQCHTPEAFLWHHLQGVFAACASEHPTICQHPAVQRFVSGLHQAMVQSSQANSGPAKPIGATEDSKTSHRMGRKDPRQEIKEEQEELKQPGTRPPEPEKISQQPGHRTREPDEKPWANQPGGESRELNKSDAMEPQELPLPMVLQATPSEAPDPVGPPPQPLAVDVAGQLVMKTLGGGPTNIAGTPHTHDAGLVGGGNRFGPGGGIDMSKKRVQQSPMNTKPASEVAANAKQARHSSPVRLDDGAARAMHAELFLVSPKVATGAVNFPNQAESLQLGHPSSEPVTAGQSPSQTVPHVSAEGGIVAFGNDTNPLASEVPVGGEIPSQELLLAVAEKETQNHASFHHTVLVFRNDHCQPIPVLVDKEATIGSVTVAEERLGTLQQPIAVYNCLGSAIKLSERISPCQQVFLQEIQSGECGVHGVIPSLFHSSGECTRIQALWKQEAWVAVDEMDHYLHMISSANPVRVTSPCPLPRVVEDDEMERILHHWFTQLLPPTDVSTKAISALLVNGHWFPVVITPDAGKVNVHTTPAGMSWVEIGIRNQGFEYTIIPVPFPLVTKFRNDCGFQTVAWLMDSLIASDFGEPLHRVPPIAIPTAIAWRQTFERHLLTSAQDQCLVQPSQIRLGGALTSPVELATQQVAKRYSTTASYSKVLGVILAALCGIFSILSGWAFVLTPVTWVREATVAPWNFAQFGLADLGSRV